MLFAVSAYAESGTLTIVSEGYKADFSIYKIADENQSYTDEFSGLGLDLTAIASAADMASAADVVESYISSKGISCIERKSGNDSVEFDGLSDGVYFLEFNKTENADMESFIINLPYYDLGMYLYDVTVNAKVSTDSGGGSGDGGGGGSSQTTTEATETTTTAEKSPSSGNGSSQKPDSSSSGNGVEESTAAADSDDTDVDKDDDDSDDDDDADSHDHAIAIDIDDDEPDTEITTGEFESTTEGEAADQEQAELPKTGGDKTVLLCFYVGGVFMILGFAILIVNNAFKFKRA